VKNEKWHRNLNKHLIYIVILCICTTLIFSMGIVKAHKAQKSSKVYNNLILSTYGDSITSQGLWQPYVVSQLEFIKQNNYGKSRTLVSGDLNSAMWQDARIDKISKDSNVILFMGGTNDWTHNVPLGILGSKDTKTFYGALDMY